MTDITIGSAVFTGLLGYAVVFFGLILLMAVIVIMGKIMTRSAAAAPEATVKADPAELKPAVRPEAPGSAGEIRLYDTDPKTAAMIMAIVADSLGKPVNELRFLSIREVRE